MSIKGKRPDFGAVLSILIFSILLAYLVVFGIINFPGFAYFCTTDMYEDTLVARLMWEQKTLFPENFLFGNQFYVIASPVLAALFYGITGSMNTAMGIATSIMGLFILICMYWMLMPFVKQRHIRLAALLALVAGVYGPITVVREDGQLFFVMCSFYACYLISFFFLMGDYARARENTALRPISFCIALFLSFCTGMQSLRQTCVSMLPIMFFEALSQVNYFLKNKSFNFKSRAFIRAVAYLCANIAGIVFINLLNIKRNEIYYGQSVFNGASLSDKIDDMIAALYTVSGLDFTLAGNCFFIIIFAFYTITVIWALLSLLKRRDFHSAGAVFWWLCIISALAVIAASFVTSVKLRPIYLFTLYTLPALSIIVLYPRINAKLQNILCTVLCIIAALNIYHSYYDNLCAISTRSESPKYQIAQYAMENGFKYVYGSHSHTAPGIAVHSDGKLIAGCWEDEVIFKVSPHINIKNIYHLTDYDKALFVFIDQEVPLAKLEAEGGDVELTFLGRYGRFYLYKTSKQMIYPISENINEAWLFPEYN